MGWLYAYTSTSSPPPPQVDGGGPPGVKAFVFRNDPLLPTPLRPPLLFLRAPMRCKMYYTCKQKIKAKRFFKSIQYMQKFDLSLFVADVFRVVFFIIESYHLDTAAIIFHHDFEFWKLCFMVEENKSMAHGVCVWVCVFALLCVSFCTVTRENLHKCVEREGPK